MLKPQLNLDSSQTSAKNPKTLLSSEKVTVGSVVVAYKNSRTQFLSFAHLPHLSNPSVMQRAATVVIGILFRSLRGTIIGPLLNLINIGSKDGDADYLEITNFVLPGARCELHSSESSRRAGDLAHRELKPVKNLNKYSKNASKMGGALVLGWLGQPARNLFGI